MNLFANGTLDPGLFDASLDQVRDDLIVEAAETRSSQITSTHLLLMLARIPHGATHRMLARIGLSPAVWVSALRAAGDGGSGIPPMRLDDEAFDDSARAALNEASGIRHPVNDAALLVGALRHATKRTREDFAAANFEFDRCVREAEKDIVGPVTGRAVFDARGMVAMDAFSASAKRALRAMQGEAEALGYALADPRHLALALAAREEGPLACALHLQDVSPKLIHKALLLSLRGRASRMRSGVPLDREHLLPLLGHILNEASALAAATQEERISERSLVLALLGTESAAMRIIASEVAEKKGSFERLRLGIERADAQPEPDDAELASIGTVRERLFARLVGQEQAIERILPYVQRMRFGFATPGRPVGTFLFCGQSGCGKTEMAKELARAVYGSEDNLIFLEMGQFNSRESMNIFVGAPPGYVGYGEGKLTNGLRDKPRSVVLFDEVEKAEPKVLDALLRFLDEGRIDDPAGPVRDGTQCIAILTSNVAATELSRLWNEVAADKKRAANWRAEVRGALRQEFEQAKFRIEFLNRVDELILFRPLGEADYVEIARRLLDRELGRLKMERDISVRSDDSVAREIGRYCGAVNEGARAVQRLANQIVITPVIRFVLENQIEPPAHLAVSASNPSGEKDSEPVGEVERVS